MNVNIKTVASYVGHNVNKNKTISLTLKFGYDTITKYIQTIQMLNENIDIVVKIPDVGTVRLGNFMINNISIDHDGEGKIKFNSQVDYVELNNISKLIDTEMFKISLIAEIEEEEKEDES